MKNEIGRKITSLTLMTIMIAGGMTFAVPGMMPAAHAANANLFVSAENSQFDNYMSGPQVIEVVIIDSDINDTDEAKGEPDVTVNGATLRMVQAVDGNWYGYFADAVQAQIADRSANINGGNDGEGLDFGTFCNRLTDVLNNDGGGGSVTLPFTIGVDFELVVIAVVITDISTEFRVTHIVGMKNFISTPCFEPRQKEIHPNPPLKKEGTNLSPYQRFI